MDAVIKRQLTINGRVWHFALFPALPLNEQRLCVANESV